MDLLSGFRIFLLVISSFSVNGIISNLKMTSDYPLSPIELTWTLSMSNDTETEHILISIQNSTQHCVAWLTLRCSDCNNTTPYRSPDFTNNCGLKFSNETFPKTKNRFSVIVNSSQIQPYTAYSAHVIEYYSTNSNNTWSVSNTTAQYMSTQVLNLAVSSQFPNRSLELNWTKPSQPNGIVVIYIVIVQTDDDKKQRCILWWSINCKDCRSNITGSKGSNNVINNCTNGGNGVSYSNNDTSFNIFTSDALILAYTNYLVNVVPINEYGWGQSTNKSITTAQFKSSAVRNFTYESYFPVNNLVFDWIVPAYPNGKIINYYIYLFDNNTCQFFINVICSDCNPIVTSKSTNYGNISCETSLPSYNFNASDTYLRVQVTSTKIQPNKAFNVSIIPLNDYGLGTETVKLIKTASYKPPNVSSFNSSVNGTIVTIFWSPPLNDSYIYSYGLNFTKDANHSVFKINSTKYYFDGINFCQWIRSCVRTLTPYGEGEELCIKDHTDLSGAIINSISTKSINDTIIVDWTTSLRSKCNVTYAVFWNESNITTFDQNYIIRNLKYYTGYNITVTPSSRMDRVDQEQSGVANSSFQMTEIGCPDKVREFQCINVTYNEFNCSWKEPIDRNGPSLQYLVQCQIDKEFGTKLTTYLWASFSKNVVPDVNYTCTITANTSICPGPESSSTFQITGSEMPGVVDETKITSIMSSASDDSTMNTINVMLPYNQFTEKQGRIIRFSLIVVVKSKGTIAISSRTNKLYDKKYSECAKGYNCPYEIILVYPSTQSRQKRVVDSLTWSNKMFTLGKGDNCAAGDGYSCNGELSSNTEYEIAIRAYTNTGFGTFGFVIIKTKYNSLAVAIAVPIVIVLLLVALFVGIFVYRRRRESPSTRTNMRQSDDIKFRDSCAKVSTFGDYYKYLTKDSCIRASEQFSEISQKWKDLENTKKLIYYQGDEKKNRFRNIKPYEHNIVKLQGPLDSYINASRICPRHFSVDANDQCQCTNCYIATQGPIGKGNDPKVPTIGDFWRMAFENNARLIINLTKCIESYKDKCAQYWPEIINEEEVHSSGDHSITVRLCRVVTDPNFDERELIVSMDGKETSIIQLHFTAWPDQDCPNIQQFLTFYERFNSLRTVNDTIMVHCSAGVGRTGTFILIDIELRKALLDTDLIEIYNTLVNLRNSRCWMVQTEKQYIFVHAIIYEHLKQNGMITRKGKSNNAKRLESTYSYLNPAYD